MNNPVGWFEIFVDDMNRAKKFYETVFGVSLSKLDSPGRDMWAFAGQMNAYGAPGSLVKMQGMSPGGNSILVYFSCADCAVEEAKAAKSGGRIVQQKTSIGQYGFITLLHDTEGNMIGLHSMK
jgi:uncharacterized protein